ncbi:MAG: sulfotransferase domain-containing protein [Planctomycetes bacterium]|nr:sulfotransferase domain-containing protein [Planctomycetota bacterium]
MNVKLRIQSISHHMTWFLGTRFPKTFPLVFVVGYPKSGTTWACQLVADYLQLPFPQFSLLPIGCHAIIHGHERVWKNCPKGVYIIRDGRDALVSQYFFRSRSIPEGDHPQMTAYQRRSFPGLVNKANVKDNITSFLKRQLANPRFAKANWGQHARSYFEVANTNVVLLRYEDLLTDGPNTLAQAMSKLTSQPVDLERAQRSIDRFSFKKQAGRSAGQEDRSAFLRKGQTGDWRNHFTKDAAKIFDKHCGDMLIQAGYESDHSWVDTFCSEISKKTTSVGSVT